MRKSSEVLPAAGPLACKSCESVHQRKFISEVTIHFEGLRNISKEPVLVFPELLVCLDGGKAEFVIHKDDLVLLVRAGAIENI